MQAFYNLGRWLFVLPFTIIGLMHFMNTEVMAETMVPSFIPEGMRQIAVYAAGALVIAAAVCIAIGKMDRLAALLLAGFLLAVVLMVHVPNAMNPTKGQYHIMYMMKDLSLIGAALLYAGWLAKDRNA